MIRCQSCAFVFSVRCWGCSIMECVPTACRLHPDFAIPQRQGPRGYATTGTCTTKHVSFLAMRHHQLRQNAKTDEQGKSRCEIPLDPAAPSPPPPGAWNKTSVSKTWVSCGAWRPVPGATRLQRKRKPEAPNPQSSNLRLVPPRKTNVQDVGQCFPRASCPHPGGLQPRRALWGALAPQGGRT